MYSFEKKIVEMSNFFTVEQRVSKKQYWKFAEHATPFKLFGVRTPCGRSSGHYAVSSRKPQLGIGRHRAETSGLRLNQRRGTAISSENYESGRLAAPARVCASRPNKITGLSHGNVYTSFSRGVPAAATPIFRLD